MQQNSFEDGGVANKAFEEQEGFSDKTVEEGIGEITRVWAGPDCKNSGTI